MTKVLMVSGDDDFSALIFEKSKWIKYLSELPEKCESKGGTIYLQIGMDTIKVELFEFGNICPKFLKFLEENFIDYDEVKSKNYYIIEEK